MIRFLSLILGLVFTISPAVSQTQKKVVEKLIDQFSETVSSQPDSAYYYIAQATVKCRKINDGFLMSRCLFNLGYFFYLQNNAPKAEAYFMRSLAESKAAKNFKITVMSLNQLGLIEADRGHYNNSLKYYLKGLDVAQKKELDKNLCAILINIGSLYEYQKDTVKALDYYLQAEKKASKNQYPDMLLSAYGSIAIVKRKTDIQYALKYYKKAYQIACQLNDKYEQFNTLINLSYGYLSLNSALGDQQAYKSLKKAEQIALELNNSEHLFYVYFNLGAYHFNRKQYAFAVNYYQKALGFSESKITPDQKLNLFKALSEVYVKTNDYARALRFEKRHNNLKDSLFSIEKSKNFNEIITRYEVEKKNLTIKLLSKEKQIEKKQKLLAIILSLLLIVPLGLLLWIYRNRVKAQKLIREKENKIFEQQRIQLIKDREIKHITGILEGQDQERNRVAREIHDGVSGKLAGLKLQLSQINSRIENENIQSIILGIGDLFQELRAISHNLSQNHLIDQNLETVLTDVFSEYKGRNEFQIEWHIYPEHSLDMIDTSVKHHLYRIIQELLSNISKHAQAKQVIIGITRHEKHLNLMIEDDGVGFEKNKKPGIGLKNIQERLELIHGTMTLESNLGKGSIVVIDIPISEYDKNSHG